MENFFNVVSHYQKIKSLYFRYERWLMPATLVIGFLVDYITFTNIQLKITLSLLLFYWVITGATIAFTNFYDTGKLSLKFRYLRLFAPLLIQFTFGALLGSSMVFYWFSGAFSISWPFMAIIAMLMVSNDVLRHYFLKPIVQISVYFFTTISLFSIILPILFHSLSAWLFMAAGAASLAVFYFYIRFLSSSRDYMRQQKKYFLASIATIFFTMNVLYFANIIPPIPLALREAGMYHNIRVSNRSYVMAGEAEGFWQTLIHGQTLRLKPGERAYGYNSIFAPAELRAAIFHHWQHYDEEKKDWVEKDALSFTITGGRKEGYKGYSWESNLAPGRWRIYVKNYRGQVLGIIRFNVERTQEEVKLQETIR